MKTLLCAIAKCENRYMMEWITWHLKLGFDKIVVYDNNNSDGERIRDVVGDLQGVQIIEWIDKKQTICETQVSAYNDCYKNNTDADWIMYLDIDEFLELNGFGSIQEYLSQDWIKDTDIIKFHWKCYSDNGRLYAPAGLVTENFTELCSDRNVNIYTKSIYRGGLKNLKMTNVHFCSGTESCHYQNGSPCKVIRMTTDKNINYDCGWVRHYVTKSVEEFVNIKYARRNPGISKSRLNNSFYFKYNKYTKEKDELFRRLVNELEIKQKQNIQQKQISNTNTYRPMSNEPAWCRMIPPKKQVPSIYELERPNANKKQSGLEQKCNIQINDKIIVSFTSYARRFEYIPKVIDSILKNTIKPYKICLTLAKKDYEQITDEIKRLADFNIIEIIIAEEDLRPHNKYFYVMQKYRNNPIITIDDDCLYSNDLISSLFNAYKKHPNCIIARRTHKKTYINKNICNYKNWIFEYKSCLSPTTDIVATGVGGVLYPPDILRVNDSWLETIKSHITVDDIVLHYFELKNNIKILYVPNNRNLPQNVMGSQKTALCMNENIKNNDIAIFDLLSKPVSNKIIDKISYDKKLNCKNNLHVLIVNYKQLQHTKNLIQNLLEQTSNFDLTVFSQQSDEDTVSYFDMLKTQWDYKNRELNIIYNDVNAPLNHIWNWFYKNTTSNYIALLNNDILICDNFISDAEQIFEKEKSCGIIIHPTNRKEFTKQNELKYEFTNECIVQGWDFIFRREAYNVIPNCLWLWRGDDYLTISAYNKWKIVYDISSPIIHFHSSTVKSVQNDIKSVIEHDVLAWRQLGYKDYIFKNNKYTIREFNGLYNLDKTSIKKICYTVITGDYDKLNEPVIISSGWRYICFTNNKNLKSNTWEFLSIPEELKSFNNIKQQRLLKINPSKYLPAYDECIYLDGNITIKCDLNDFIKRYVSSDFYTVKHPERNCIYDECDAVLKYCKDTKENVEEIRAFLKKEQYPHNIGLAETNLIYRKNTQNVYNICNEWSKQMVSKKTHRDQLTFNYVLWKSNNKIEYFPSDIVKNGKLFILYRHKR